MGIKSAKNTSNYKQSNTNENYRIGGLVFPFYDLYGVLHNINKNLSSFYTETGEEYDFDEFDEICKMIKIDISFLKDLAKNDHRVSEFLHNNRLKGKFSSLFGSIYNAFIEAMTGGNKCNNEIKKMQNKKIKEIVRDLAYIAVNPFTSHMV